MKKVLKICGPICIVTAAIISISVCVNGRADVIKVPAFGWIGGMGRWHNDDDIRIYQFANGEATCYVATFPMEGRLNPRQLAISCIREGK